MDSSMASLAHGDDEIKPYRIHVSSKYLDLTKKKLELTRLPHELLLPKSREWENGAPKSEIEPLVDFWLEQYSWRLQETHLNTTLPQFRTAIKHNGSNHPLRIHFLHIKSPHAHALPLLLIPTFPFTNLSLTPLFGQLSDPQIPTSSQPFHLVVPSIPGLGFSDAFHTPLTTNSEAGIGDLSQTAALFNTLMVRLGYEFYLASATGSGVSSPSHIDYHLTRLIGETYPQNCLGIHLIAPPISRPRFGSWEWVKFETAQFFHANVWGYEKQDWTALHAAQKFEQSKKNPLSTSGESQPLLSKVDVRSYGAVGQLGLREPNTLAYALCDSPVGLLSLVCSALKRTSPSHKLSKTDIIDFTQLAWLPGPEAGIMFWSNAVKEVERLGKDAGKSRSRAAITVFGADGIGEGYVCPAWCGVSHEVIFSQRVSGASGLTVWERTDVIIDGIQGLAREIDVRDARIRISGLEEVVIGRAEETIVEGNEDDGHDHGMQLDAESPDTVVAVDLS